jgi:serine/threonine-protein kinase RIO1
MNIITSSSDLSEFNIFYNEKVNNTVIDNSHFIRINYSNELFTLTGLFLKINMNINDIEKYFNKFKYSYNLSPNKVIIDKLIKLEEDLLDIKELNNLKKTFKLKEQLLSMNIRTFDNINPIQKTNIYSFLLKISGIWLTDTQCGLTFKFLPCESIR